jgi:subtilase family serine protease
MPLTKKQIVSAQVVLQPASGKSPSSETAITSETIEDFLPSQHAVAVARKAFKEVGFEVGEVVAITGSVSTFEKALKTRLRREPESGAMKAVRTDGSATYELPLKALPKEVARIVEAVSFTPPPDFGPTNY